MPPPEQLKDRIAIYQYPKIETYLTGNVKIRLWRGCQIKSVPSGSFFHVCHMLRHQWMCTLSLCLNVGVFSPNCWDIVATWNYSLGHPYHLSRQGDLRALIVFEFCNIVKWLRHSDICPFFSWVKPIVQMLHFLWQGLIRVVKWSPLYTVLLQMFLKWSLYLGFKFILYYYFTKYSRKAFD